MRSGLSALHPLEEAVGLRREVYKELMLALQALNKIADAIEQHLHGNLFPFIKNKGAIFRLFCK